METKIFMPVWLIGVVTWICGVAANSFTWFSFGLGILFALIIIQFLEQKTQDGGARQ